MVPRDGNMEFRHLKKCNFLYKGIKTHPFYFPLPPEAGLPLI
jgi:hypothetical protein